MMTLTCSNRQNVNSKRTDWSVPGVQGTKLVLLRASSFVLVTRFQMTFKRAQWEIILSNKIKVIKHNIIILYSGLINRSFPAV